MHAKQATTAWVLQLVLVMLLVLVKCQKTYASLAKALNLVATGSVRQKGGIVDLDGNVVLNNSKE